MMGQAKEKLLKAYDIYKQRHEALANKKSAETTQATGNFAILHRNFWTYFSTLFRNKGILMWKMEMILHHTSWFNQVCLIKANRFGLPQSCQICLNPVWRMGCEGERSEPGWSNASACEAGDHSPPILCAGITRTSRTLEPADKGRYAEMTLDAVLRSKNASNFISVYGAWTIFN